MTEAHNIENKLAEKHHEKEAKEVEAAKQREATEKESPSTAKEKISAKKDEKKGDGKEEVVFKRTAVVPLVKAYAKPAKKRAGRAIKILREYASRHGKTTIDKVKISPKLASFINARGSKHPPKKLKVSLSKDKQGNVKVTPA